MSELQTVNYRFVKITTTEFAIVSENMDVSKIVNVNISSGFNFNAGEKSINCNAKCTYLQEDKTLLIAAISCTFIVVPEDWPKIHSAETHEYFLTRQTALHFVSLTIGTLRGVIHVKTDRHILNTIVVPPIDVNSIVKEDIRVKEALTTA